MANAAAKKAAAAKKEATQIYGPILLVTNLIYFVLLLGGAHTGMTKFEMLGAFVTWIEQAYAFVGILDKAAASAGNKKNKDLVGGSSLDLLAVTILVQFLSVLHSPKWLWLTLVVVPVLGLYGLYKTFYPSEPRTAAVKKSSKEEEPDPNDPKTAKRQKRAEKRRQKWN